MGLSKQYTILAAALFLGACQQPQQPVTTRPELNEELTFFKSVQQEQLIHIGYTTQNIVESGSLDYNNQIILGEVDNLESTISFLLPAEDTPQFNYASDITVTDRLYRESDPLRASIATMPHHTSYMFPSLPDATEYFGDLSIRATQVYESDTIDNHIPSAELKDYLASVDAESFFIGEYHPRGEQYLIAQIPSVPGDPVENELNSQGTYLFKEIDQETADDIVATIVPDTLPPTVSVSPEVMDAQTDPDYSLTVPCSDNGVIDRVRAQFQGNYIYGSINPSQTEVTFPLPDTLADGTYTLEQITATDNAGNVSTPVNQTFQIE